MSFSIPELVELIQADFTARSLDVVAEFGDWKVATIKGAGRVVFGVSTFNIGPPDGQRAPGVAIIPGSDPPMGARSLMTRIQTCPVWVHAKGPDDPKTPKRAELTQRAAADLLHATLAALYRVAHGSLGMGDSMGVTNGTWLRPASQEFTYGSLVTFAVEFCIPVLDDPMPYLELDPAQARTQTIALLGDGEHLVSEQPAPE